MAETPEQYVRRAVSFATDFDSLARLRSGMRERIRQSALFDVRLFATHFGAALEDIWAEHLATVGRESSAEADLTQIVAGVS